LLSAASEVSADVSREMLLRCFGTGWLFAFNGIGL